MKLLKFVLIALIAFSSSFCLAENSANYRYAGNTIGKEVCRAIVNDDVNALRRALHSYRQTLVYAYSFNNPASRALAGGFTCNDMDLQDFSNSVGAQRTFGFLSVDAGHVGNQVVSVEK
jgi:hypothetical protein